VSQESRSTVFFFLGELASVLTTTPPFWCAAEVKGLSLSILPEPNLIEPEAYSEPKEEVKEEHPNASTPFEVCNHVTSGVKMHTKLSRFKCCVNLAHIVNGHLGEN
jgi:hypothetical protein